MHMTNGASFNLTNKKHIDNPLISDQHTSYSNQVFIGSNGSEGGSGGLN